MKRTPLPRSRKPIARSPIKKRPRKKSETLRIYGPPARRAFVASLPCAACGVVGYSENAHIETGGMGRKADADKIVPLCGGQARIGCHSELHLIGRETFETVYGIDLDVEAQKIHSRWLAEDTETT